MSLMSSTLRRSFTFAAISAVVAGASFLYFGYGSARALPLAAAVPKFGVSGFLTAGVGNDTGGGSAPLGYAIFVPGVQVILEDVLHGSSTGPVSTDLSGRFVFPPRSASQYRVCWTAPGFVSGCGNVFKITGRHLHLGNIAMAVQQGPGLKTCYGKVKLADGSLPRTFEPMANVNALARVTYVSGGPVSISRQTYVNNYGDYILPGLPSAFPFTLQAAIENVSRSTLVNGPGIVGLFKKVDITLKNRRPEIQGLRGDDGAGKHWTAAPGQAVTVTAHATDPDGDALQYRWLLPDGSSVLHAAAGETVTYTMPERPGRFEFTAVVYDGRGGYAKESVAINTEGVRFGGTVAATDAPVVPGAEVEINGQTVTTNAQGRFHLLVPESARYVLNIRKAGYGLVSRVYDNALTGGRWVLTRASVRVVDPSVGIDVTDDRQPGDCPGSLSDRRQPNQTTHCGPGIRVRIPANALLDENGNPPAGLIEVHLTTTDLRAPDGMPGDWGATDPGGNRRVMESWGAGTVDLRGGGHRYNLRPGASATLHIPIHPSQLSFPAAIAPAIPLLTYDETAGLWRQEGVATRAGNTYVGKVKHFSAFNMDQLKVGQACVRLETTLMPAEFDLEVTIPSSGGGAPTVVTRSVTNQEQRFHVIYNLETNQDIELRAFENDNPIEFLQPPPAPPVEALEVNTGGAQDPTDPNEPEFPYGACKVSVELTPARLPPDNTNLFLAGVNAFRAANLTELDALNPGDSGPFLAAAEDYYDTIDPKGFRRDLTDFKDRNGFPADEIVAKYANSGDLGFGRDMHCRNSGQDVACYVTNYGNRFTDDEQDLDDANGNVQPVATVGMEYSRIEDPAGDGSTFITNPDGTALRVVKFYVFEEALESPVNAGEFNGRSTSADLDGLGRRPVPQLCMVCHGGRYPGGNTTGVPTWNPADPTTANLHSAFIPFDLISLTTPDNAAQQALFKSLNQDIVLATNPPDATVEVIDAMYAGGAALDQVIGFFVPGWSSVARATLTDPNEREVYAGVVAPSCRSCHISQGPTDIAWDNGSQFKSFGSLVDGYVCYAHYMPHALVTHNRFWLSTGPHQPLMLHDFLNDATLPGTGTGSDCVLQP